MKKIKWPTHPAIMVSVAFCFNSDKKLLLVKQKDRNFWSPPSGEIEENESPVQATIRETKEEINLDVKVVKALTPLIKWQSEYKNATVILFHFLCEIEKGKVKHMRTSEPQYDVINHRWVSLGDILKKKIKIAPNVLSLIGELKAYLKYFKNGRFIK